MWPANRDSEACKAGGFLFCRCVLWQARWMRDDKLSAQKAGTRGPPAPSTTHASLLMLSGSSGLSVREYSYTSIRMILKPFGVETLCRSNEADSHFFKRVSLGFRLWFGVMFRFSFMVWVNVMVSLGLGSGKGWLQIKTSYKLTLVQCMKWQHLCIKLYLVPFK